jgi:hypothetical protein
VFGNIPERFALSSYTLQVFCHKNSNAEHVGQGTVWKTNTRQTYAVVQDISPAVIQCYWGICLFVSRCRLYVLNMQLKLLGVNWLIAFFWRGLEIGLSVCDKISEYVNRSIGYVAQQSLLGDRRLPPRLNWILPSSGLIRGVRWFETDVSGLPVSSVLKGQAVFNRRRKNSTILLLLLLLLLLLFIVTFVQGIYTSTPEKKTMSLGNTVLQLCCSYCSWCM